MLKNTTDHTDHCVCEKMQKLTYKKLQQKHENTSINALLLEHTFDFKTFFFFG